MTEQQQIDVMMEKARAAQRIYEKFSQKQVDSIVRAVARAVYDHAEELARMTQDETKMGTYEAKLAQNLSGITWMWGHMKNQKSRGILRRLEDLNMVELAKPMGVISSVAPVTAPVLTPAHNIMCALKCGNAIIVSPHPGSKVTCVKAIGYMIDAITKLGAPENLIQVITEPTFDMSKLLMQSTDVCLEVSLFC